MSAVRGRELLALIERVRRDDYGSNVFVRTPFDLLCGVIDGQVGALRSFALHWGGHI